MKDEKLIDERELKLDEFEVRQLSPEGVMNVWRGYGGMDFRMTHRLITDVGYQSSYSPDTTTYIPSRVTLSLNVEIVEQGVLRQDSSTIAKIRKKLGLT